MIKKCPSRVFRKISDERGATAIEYGLIAAGISVSMIVIVTTIGTDLVAMFQSISDYLQ